MRNGGTRVEDSENNTNLPHGMYAELTLANFIDDAKIARETLGKSDLYPMQNFPGLAHYLSGGFGRKNSYELVVLSGRTGHGKSSFAMQMCLDSAMRGDKQGWIIMEEPVPDQINNFARFITGDNRTEEAMDWAYEQVKDNIEFMDPRFFDESFNTDNILEWIKIRHERGTNLFLFDHLNWAFDSADDLATRDPWPKQRKFVKRLARLCQELKITVILVAHSVKGAGAKEMNREDRVAASKAVMEVATRGIWVENTKDGFLVEQIKARGLQARWFPWYLDRSQYCFREKTMDEMTEEQRIYIAENGLDPHKFEKRFPSYWEIAQSKL